MAGSAVHALRTGVMSATECCSKCFGDDGCSFYTYTNATSTTSAASEINGARRYVPVLSGTTGQGGVKGHASLSIQSADDVVLSGGAVLTSDPLLAIRSGSPKQHTTVAFALPLSPGAVISSLSFSYRYNSGYGKDDTGVGTNLTVLIAGKPVYHSPHMRDYSYDHNRTNYSVPVPVHIKGLSIPGE